MLKRTLIIGFVAVVGITGNARANDEPAKNANLANPTVVITAQRDGYTIAGLVTHWQDVKSFKHGIALFPGRPGIMRLHVEDGQPRFELAGNFLTRTRRHWLDAETLVVVVDAPSDTWATFSQSFRETPRYGADVAALLKDVAGQYPVGEWTFVGTSEGSISALHAARMNPSLAKRTILTSSLFSPTRHGPGLSSVSWKDYPKSLLWVHHENDPCKYTTYREAKHYAKKTGAPLLTVRDSGPWRGGACEAHTSHGFVGVERETVLAMRAWVKTGSVPGDVAP